jgi:hypothetical protein
MRKLQRELKLVTHEFMTTNSHNSHKKTRLFLEMQELNRKIKALRNCKENTNQ